MHRREFLKLLGASASFGVALAAIPWKETQSTMTTAYRAFTATSYWNTPIPASVGVDPNNAKMIAWLKTNETGGMGLGMKDWAMPDYMASATDPLATVTDKSGKTVKIHIPKGVTMMSGNDKAMNIIDPSTNQNLQTFETVKVSDIKYTCTGMARYWLDSTGIAADVVGGTAGNYGHRGIPGAVHAIRLDELAEGVIRRRLKFATSGPGEPGQWGLGTKPIYPMDGYEKGHGDGPPEGVVIRLKQSVDLSKVSGAARVIATCLRDYGALLGETGGHATIKLQQASSYPAGLSAKSLSVYGWDQWEFVKAGWTV